MRNGENQNKAVSKWKSKVSKHSVLNTVLCLSSLRREVNEIMMRSV